MAEKQFKKRVYNKETKEETKIWKDMCKYIETEIMGYDENQKLSTQMCQRLRGTLKGKQFGNVFVPDGANYSYETVFYTFKINKGVILNAVSNKEFDTEMAKFRYIVVIVENNINDVYLRLKKVKESKEKTETINTENISYDGAEYSRKTDDLKTDRLKNLW
ncbi:hypothetical protein [Anaerosporobacter sp.]